MQEPCRTCPEKKKDFGGCRCQALALTGDAANADPVCSKSPHHGLVADIVLQAARKAAAPAEQPILFRTDANSRRFFDGAA
jgi:pyrroloquinoline quinone biosynthesis protein E